MTVADRMGQPAQAVVPAGGDDRVLSVLVHGFFTDQVSEYVICAGYPPPVPVDVQGQVAFFVILEGLRISHLVDSFPYLSEAVVAVPDGAAVPVRDPGDLASGIVLVALKDFVWTVFLFYKTPVTNLISEIHDYQKRLGL